jgi:hypothetical protein
VAVAVATAAVPVAVAPVAPEVRAAGSVAVRVDVPAAVVVVGAVPVQLARSAARADVPLGAARARSSAEPSSTT